MVRRLNVLEAGAGAGVRAVLKKAYHSEKKRTGRNFIVVDKKVREGPLILDVLIRRALGRMPAIFNLPKTVQLK